MDECVRVLDHMPERNPTDGTFELTIRCNLHCKMCLFRHDDSETAEIMAKELTAAQWIDMARQVAEAGTLSLLITGGEPMLRPDFCEIWEGIYKQGFVITLYTNATLVTPKIMETLRKYPPHKIGVTIYGASPETYEKVTGSAAAFEKAMEGIRQLKTLPSKLNYRMTVIKDNFDDFEGVANLIKARFDPNGELITTRVVTKAVRGGCSDVDACRLPPERNIELSLLRTISKIKSELGSRFSEGRIGVYADSPSQHDSDAWTPSLFGCNAGVKSYTVSWDGCLLGCQVMGAFAQQIKSSFIDAWRAFPHGVSLPPIPPKCQNCTISEYCSLCPGFRYAETGSFSGVPDYICSDTEAVYKMITTHQADTITSNKNVEFIKER